MNIWTYIYYYSFPFIMEWNIVKIEKIGDTVYAYLDKDRKCDITMCSTSPDSAIEIAKQDTLNKYENEVRIAKEKYDSRIESLHKLYKS